MAIEACRIALKYMTPVILLTDGYLANGAEPWKIPKVDSLPRFPVKFRTEPDGFHPFFRDPTTLARNWAIPGTPGLTHRIGGIGKITTRVTSRTTRRTTRRCPGREPRRFAGIANDVPEQKIALGEDKGKLLVLGWGSTYGAIHEAVSRCRTRGLDVSHAHLNYINPMPRNFGELLKRFDRVLIPELNMGQLVQLVRSRYLVPAESLPKIRRGSRSASTSSKRRSAR